MRDEQSLLSTRTVILCTIVWYVLVGARTRKGACGIIRPLLTCRSRISTNQAVPSHSGLALNQLRYS